MKIFLKILFLFFIVASVEAQPITWQRTYGDGNIDYGYSIVQTPDDGFIPVGRKRIETITYMFE